MILPNDIVVCVCPKCNEKEFPKSSWVKRGVLEQFCPHCGGETKLFRYTSVEEIKGDE